MSVPVEGIGLFAEFKAVAQQQHEMIHEQVRERISALLDGEITDAEIDLLTRQLIRDQGLNAEWARQCATKQHIHDWLSGQAPMLPRAHFAETVMQRIQSDALQAVGDGAPHSTRWRGRRLWAGLSAMGGRIAGAAIAASAAAVTLLVLQTQFTERQAGFTVQSLAAMPAATDAEAPQLVSVEARTMNDALQRYLLTHDVSASATALREGPPYTPVVGAPPEWLRWPPSVDDGRVVGDAAVE